MKSSKNTLSILITLILSAFSGAGVQASSPVVRTIDPMGGCLSDYEAEYVVQNIRRRPLTGATASTVFEFGTVVATGVINPVTIAALSTYHHVKMKKIGKARALLVAAHAWKLRKMYPNEEQFHSAWRSYINHRRLDMGVLYKNPYFLANARSRLIESHYYDGFEINKNNDPLWVAADSAIAPLFDELRQDPQFNRNVSVQDLVDAIDFGNDQRIFCPYGIKPYSLSKIKQWLKFYLRY